MPQKVNVLTWFDKDIALIILLPEWLTDILYTFLTSSKAKVHKPESHTIVRVGHFISQYYEKMKFFQEIVLRHNECIVRLSDKNLLHSYHVLQGIVTVLRAHISEAPLPISSILPSSEAWALHPKTEPILQELGIDGTYDRPLMLFCNDAMISDDELSMNLLSATVLFNLALVCHRIGIMYNIERSLAFATRLYLVVTEIFQDPTYTSCHPALLLLSLAIHNLGHLQNSVHNYSGYHRCMKALWNLIPHMILKNDPIEHYMLCSLRIWKNTRPPVAAAA